MPHNALQPIIVSETSTMSVGPVAVINRIRAASGAIREGSTIARVKMPEKINRAFRLEVENYSDQRLHYHEYKIQKGKAVREAPPVDIEPGTSEAMAGRSRAGALGCYGTVSWIIGNSGKMIVIMYSCPFDHNLYKNWLSVGIFDKGSTKGFANKMYYKRQNGFKRKKFHKDLSPLFYGTKGLPFAIKATMENSYKPEIRVQLYPTTVQRLADTLTRKGIRTST